MAAPTGAYVYKDASIEIDEVEYANQHSKAVLIPDQPIQSYRTLVPDGQVQDVDSALWRFEISALQINITGGLARALRTAQGTEVDIVLIPKIGLSMPMATFTIISLHVPFGGEQGKFQTFDGVFPVKGQPVFGTTPAS